MFLMFTPYLRKWSNLTNIVQKGWNQHLEILSKHSVGAWFKIGKRVKGYTKKEVTHENFQPTRTTPLSILKKDSKLKLTMFNLQTFSIFSTQVRNHQRRLYRDDRWGCVSLGVQHRTFLARARRLQLSWIAELHRMLRMLHLSPGTSRNQKVFDFFVWGNGSPVGPSPRPFLGGDCSIPTYGGPPWRLNTEQLPTWMQTMGFGDLMHWVWNIEMYSRWNISWNICIYSLIIVYMFEIYSVKVALMCTSEFNSDFTILRVWKALLARAPQLSHRGW